MSKKSFIKRFLLVYLFFLVGLVFPVFLFAGDKLISYQGVLTDAQGKPVEAPGGKSMTFALYTAESGGSNTDCGDAKVCRWKETKSVIVENGIFKTAIGDTNLLNISFDIQYWLGIQVESESEMYPRHKLTSVPYAMGSQGDFIVNGNVGIGTASPVSKLDIRFTDTSTGNLLFLVIARGISPTLE